MKKKKIQNKNLHNDSKISTPYNNRLTHVGVEGVTCTVLPSRLSKKYAKMASIRQLFWLVELTLDVYDSIWSLVQEDVKNSRDNCR